MKDKNKNVGVRLIKGVPAPDITASSFSAAIKSANNSERFRKILMALRKN